MGLVLKNKAFPVFFFLLALLVIGGCDCEGTGDISGKQELRARPASVTFGLVPIGKSQTKKTQIENVGQAPVTLTGIDLKNLMGGNAFELETDVKFPYVMEVEDRLTLVVKYAPKKEGVVQGELLVKTNSIDPLVIKLSATQIVADIDATPNPVDFGAVPPDEPKEMSAKIKNSGSSPLTINAFTFASNKEDEFKITDAPTLPLELLPGKDVTIKIEYTPKKPTAEEIIYVENSSSGSRGKYELKLVGNRAEPNIELDPKTLAFPGVTIGNSKTASFKIKNTGAVDLVVTEVKMDENNSFDFKLPNPPKGNIVIPPGKSETIDVLYESSDNLDDRGKVNIKSNDPDSPLVSVLLTSAAEGCNLVAQPSKATFLRNGKKNIVLTNKGTADCDYKVATLSPTTSTEFSLSKPVPSPQKLKPGQFITVQVVYESKDAIEDKGDLIIEYQDPKTPPTKVPVESKKSSTFECDIDVSPKQLLYGLVALGSSKNLTVKITNNGYGDCVVKNPIIKPNTYNEFKLNTLIPPTTGLKVGPGDSLTLDVSYTPPGGSQHSGDLILETNDQVAKELKIRLIGSTGQLCLEAYPNPLDFGTVKINCSTLKQNLEVFNVCPQTVQVTGVRFGLKTNRPATEFYLKSAPQMPYALGFNQSLTIGMTYVPVDKGKDNGTIELLNDKPGQSPIVVPLAGEGVTDSKQADEFVQTKKPMLDLLFVIDNSCSMQDDQDALSNNLGKFLTWAGNLQVDYQIGITSTDTRDRGCLIGTTNPKYVTNSTPNGITSLKSTVRLGTKGSGTERPLQVSELAFSKNALTTCNKGFYRKDASLSIIYITDEADHSGNTVTYYINFLKNLKGIRKLDKLRASAIGYKDKATCKQKNDCRLYTVTQSLRGIYEYIGNKTKKIDWGTTLTQLGAITFGYQSQFFLTRPAKESTIVVTVDGKTVNKSSSDGWQYNNTNNSITFSKSKIPGAGSKVVINYEALCLPP